MQIAILLTTVNTKSFAVRLARAALDAKAAACIQILPGIESHYVWKGKRQKTREFLVLAKTSTRKAANLEKLWSRVHPYKCPELVTLAGRAAAPYARWIKTSTST